jgi:hypothetical protein
MGEVQTLNKSVTVPVPDVLEANENTVFVAIRDIDLINISALRTNTIVVGSLCKITRVLENMYFVLLFNDGTKMIKRMATFRDDFELLVPEGEMTC